MREVVAELKQLKLHGMAGAWSDLADNGSETMLESARWLMEHLLDTRGTIDAWRKHYNEVRPHRSLNRRPPSVFARQAA
jgi:transposase InsO family protein